MTPLSAMVQMRPAFDYLDRADTRHRAEAANTSIGDGGMGALPFISICISNHPDFSYKKKRLDCDIS